MSIGEQVKELRGFKIERFSDISKATSIMRQAADTIEALYTAKLIADKSITVRISEVAQDSPEKADSENISEVQKLISALSEGKCKGIKGATVYKVAQFAAEMGLI